MINNEAIVVNFESRDKTIVLEFKRNDAITLDFNHNDEKDVIDNKIYLDCNNAFMNRK